MYGLCVLHQQIIFVSCCRKGRKESWKETKPRNSSPNFSLKPESVFKTSQGTHISQENNMEVHLLCNQGFFPSLPFSSESGKSGDRKGKEQCQ